MKRLSFILIAFMLSGIGFRLYRFGAVPLALNRDEAALGYNAYSLLVAGIDEWGNHFPLTFKSFGDYKLPGYIYTLSQFMRLFGSSDWVIRLPSLLSGFGVILFTYLLIKRVTNNWMGASLAAMMVAIQPWELFYSRMAFEAHLGLWLLLLSLYLWIQKKPMAWIAGTIALMAAVLTYNTPLLLIPVMGIVTLIIPRGFWKQKGFVIGGMILVGAIAFWLLYPVTSQKQAITIMSDPTVIDAQATAYIHSSTLIEKAWNYRQMYWIRLATVRLIKSFLPQFLTISGGQNPWHTAPGTAHIYWTTYCLGLGGLLWITWQRRHQLRQLLSLWILIIGSLLPSIITIDAPHATRSLLFFWLLTAGAGLTLTHLPRKIIGIFFILLSLEFGIYTWRYFDEFPQYRSAAWPIGLRESLLQTQGKSVEIESNGSDVVADQIYIYPLLYWRVSPVVYTQTMTSNPPDVVRMNRILGFENFSTSRYNASDSAIIERHIDGSYSLKQ